MKSTEKESLIKGLFEPEDAREILAIIFRDKINFHKLKAFSIEEQTGQVSSIHSKRVKELSKSLKSILQIIKKASKDNLLLDISCDVKIKTLSKSIRKTKHV